MRLLKRNSTTFEYVAYLGKQEILTPDGKHTGRYAPTWADPVQMRGNISLPTGFAENQMFGQDLKYTHVLILNNKRDEIEETGKIMWMGAAYQIQAVRRGLNYTTAALLRQVGDGT